MSPSTTNRVTTLVAALILSSCRFGGPSGGSPWTGVDGAGGVGGSGGQAGNTASGGQAGNAASGGTAGSAATGGTAGQAGGTNPGGSAGAPVDAGDDADETKLDGGSDGGSDGDAVSLDIQTDADVTSDTEPPDSGPPTGCFPPFSSAVCDPVCNTGCPALFRCDITDMPRTGICVGTLLSTNTEGMACTRTLATDDCAERLSCIERICRRLCYRDTDCTPSAACCKGAIDVDGGPSGYKVCAPCGP